MLFVFKRKFKYIMFGANLFRFIYSYEIWSRESNSQPRPTVAFSYLFRFVIHLLEYIVKIIILSLVITRCTEEYIGD